MAKRKNPIPRAAQWILDNILWDYGKILISAVFAWAQTQFNLLGAPSIVNPVVSVIISFVLAYGAIQIAVDLYNLIWGDRLFPIAKLRTEGVKLRNRGTKMGPDWQKSQDWIAEFENWNERAKKAIGRISRADAEHWDILNKYNVRVKPNNSGTTLQRTKWSVLDEKIDRLERLYQEYRASGN